MNETIGPIEVWVVNTDAPVSVQQSCMDLLGRKERERVGRLHRPRDRAAFLVAHGILRVLLGQRLGLDPQQINFQQHARGKPYIPGCSLKYNISHSGTWAAIAITQGLELGVDIEEIDRRIETGAIARRYFHPAEIEKLNHQKTDQERRAQFFRYWTRKEAYIKALGDGLLAPLATINTEALVRPWVIEELKAPPGYAGALAYCGTPRAVIQSPVADPGEILSACASPAPCPQV